MEKVYVLDEKNNKLVFEWAAVATEKNLQYYEQNHPEREDVRQAVALIRALPVSVRNDPQGLRPSQYPRNWVDGYKGGDDLYVVLATTRPSVYLHLRDLLVTRPQLDQGLPSKEFLAAVKLLTSLNKKGVGSDKSWTRLREGLDNGNFKIEELRPSEIFSESYCYALFCCTKDGTEGYLTEAGLGPLSRAKTYDSLEEMNAAFARQSQFAYYRKLQIVKVKISLEELGDLVELSRYKSGYWGEETDFSVSSIYSVAQDVQRKNIEKALKQASEQQIIDAYNALHTQGKEERKRKI